MAAGPPTWSSAGGGTSSTSLPWTRTPGRPPRTRRRIFITVPFLVIEAPELAVTSPADGAQFENGAIPVRGTTSNAHDRHDLRDPDSGCRRHADRHVPAGLPGAGVVRQPGPASQPHRRAGHGRRELPTGRSSRPLDLSAGKWRIVVTATSAESKATTITRDVSITYHGVNLVVSIKGSTAWLKVWVDGKISKVTGAAGTVFSPGKVLTFTAKDSVEVRTGKSSVTYFTLNGDDLGHLSKQGNPETWLFAPPDPPVKTNRNCDGRPAGRRSRGACRPGASPTASRSRRPSPARAAWSPTC